MRAIDHGLYLPQLASAIDMGVPLSSIAVLQTEQLFRSQMQEPSQALSNLFDWLELPRTGEMESLGKWHATRRAGPSGGFRPPAGNRKLWSQFIAELSDFYSHFNRPFYRLLQQVGIPFDAWESSKQESVSESNLQSSILSLSTLKAESLQLMSMLSLM